MTAKLLLAVGCTILVLVGLGWATGVIHVERGSWGKSGPTGPAPDLQERSAVALARQLEDYERARKKERLFQAKKVAEQIINQPQTTLDERKKALDCFWVAVRRELNLPD